MIGGLCGPVGIAALVCGCGGGSVASELAKPPEFNPEGQTKCKVKQSQSKPLIVEWPSADRAELEVNAKSGAVVVAYAGCEMRLLSQCKAPGAYRYVAVTPKKDTVTIRDEDELYAAIPMGAAKFEAKLAKTGQLNVSTTLVGNYRLDGEPLRHDQLRGSCDGATHVVSSLTVGAFEFFAGADAEVGAGVDVVGAGAGARSTAKRETLTTDGSPEACAEATGSDAAPPDGCGALVRVTVVPLVVASASPPSPIAPPASATVALPAPAKPTTTAPSVPGMVLVPAGEFTMGSSRGFDESPAHRVYLDGFYIDRTEVTVAAYRSCVSASRCTPPGTTDYCNWAERGRDQHPINCVDHDLATAYCSYAGKRLPTEAEWEKAARGTGDRIYPWGNQAPSCQLAIMNEGGSWDQFGCGKMRTWPVGSKPAGASPYGALDMAGSVWEWVSDWYDDSYYARAATHNPKGPTSGTAHPIRGGSFAHFSNTGTLSVSARHNWTPQNRSNHNGFRCARDQ